MWEEAFWVAAPSGTPVPGSSSRGFRRRERDFTTTGPVSTPDQLAALLKADLAKYGKVIRTANIKLEDQASVIASG